MRKRLGCLILAVIICLNLIPVQNIQAAEPAFEKKVVATAEVISGGDLLIGHRILSGAKQEDGTYDFSSIFKYVDEYIQAADYAVINLETSIAGKRIPYAGFPYFNTPESLIKDAKDAGFDLFLTASNHSYDCGYDGVMNKIKVLEQNEVDYIGTRKDESESFHKVIDVNGISIGMLNYARESLNSTKNMTIMNRIITGTGGNPQNVVVDKKGKEVISRYNGKYLKEFYKTLESDIQELKDQGAEIIVAYPHWGKEYNIGYRSLEDKIAQKMCDYGVDVIIGGHPHVVEPTKVYTSDVSGKTTICIHSTGNFVSHLRKADNKKAGYYIEDGALFCFKAEKYSDGTVAVAEADVLPIWVKQSKGKYMVMPLEKDSVINKQSYKRTMDLTYEGIELFNNMAKITEQPNSMVTFLGGITVLKIKTIGENPKYQWQYSEDGGNTWKNVKHKSGETEKLVMITSKKNKNHYYRCRVRTKGGTVYSKKAALIME